MELESLEFSHYWSNVQATSWEDDYRNLVPQPQPQLSINGVDLTPLVRKLEIKRPLNGKASLSFLLGLPADSDGVVILPSDLCPPGYGAYASLIRRHNRTTARLLTLNVSIAGESRTFEFLPTNPKFDGFSLAWGGEDVCALAEAEGALGDDILADTGDHVTAHESIRMDAAAVGLQVACKFEDYRLGELRKGNGTRLAWMDRAAKTLQAARRTEGTTLIYESPPDVLNNKALPTARWKFIDRLTIQTLDMQQLEPPRNRFEAVRLKSIATILEEPKTCQGNDCIGRKRVTLSTPTRGLIQIQVTKVAEGQIGDFVFFGADDSVLVGPNTGVYTGNTPCAYFEFTYMPRISNFAYTPSWELYVRGSSGLSNQPAVQEGFSASAEDAASVDEVGLNPEFTNLEDPVFFAPATAQATVDAHLNASILRAWAANFSTPYLNPLIDPGDVIEVTDFLTRQQSEKWLVEMVGMQWEKFWGMTLDCVRPTHND